MPNIDHHAPGSFCWLELATTDQAAAKNFYTSLFGWTVTEFPMGPGAIYTIFNLEGRNTGAAFAITEDMKGMPPNWMLYMATANADETAAKAAAAGGGVIKPAFNVMDAGRMAVLRNPIGACFAVWQPVTHPGFGIQGVPGTLCWADLSTPDPGAAAPFYKAVFGWEITPGEHDDSGYLHIKNGESFIGGILPAKYRNPNAPAHWMSYIYVADCDASAAQAKELGARLYMEPNTIEKVGRMAIVADPQGAVFAIFQPIPH